MAQDIRNMMRDDGKLPSKKLEKNHEKRFRARLEQAFPEHKSGGNSGNRYLFFKVAAVLIIAFGVGFIFLVPDDLKQGEQVVETAPSEAIETKEEPAREQYQLSVVSPEFKKIENFYLASLNIELAKLEVNDGNRALVDAFMQQLAGLDADYKELNAEIRDTGLTESSVEAMISNLQLRLELLVKLKNKIRDIKNLKGSNHENQKA